MFHLYSNSQDVKILCHFNILKIFYVYPLINCVCHVTLAIILRILLEYLNSGSAYNNIRQCAA